MKPLMDAGFIPFVDAGGPEWARTRAVARNGSTAVGI